VRRDSRAYSNIAKTAQDKKPRHSWVRTIYPTIWGPALPYRLLVSSDSDQPPKNSRKKAKKNEATRERRNEGERERERAHSKERKTRNTRYSFTRRRQGGRQGSRNSVGRNAAAQLPLCAPPHMLPKPQQHQTVATSQERRASGHRIPPIHALLVLRLAWALFALPVSLVCPME
jgi:hypothetical protein